MTGIRVFAARCAGLFRRSSAERRLADEIRAHLDLLTDDYIAQGMSPEDARFAARKAFGGVDQVKAIYRDQRGLPFIDALSQDVRFAVRLLVRDRAFALTAILVLGLGIGINNMFFTLVYAHVIRGLPIDRPDRVLYISTFDDRANDRPVSWLDYRDMAAAQRSFEGLAAYAPAPVVIGDEGRAPDRFDGAYVSANAFTTVGAVPAIGRGFTDAEDRPGAAPVAMLGAGAWQSRYSSDPSVLGRSILLDGSPVTVIGVMPERSGFPGTFNVWIPLGQRPGLQAQARDARSLRVIGRLRDGVTEADARAEIDSIAHGLSAEYPETNGNVRLRVVPINDRFTGRLEGPWLAFLTAGCIIVLISSANVANLMLARAMHRVHEIAIRTSLGASRRRVIRQLLIEGVVLAAAGGAAGMLISVAGVRLFSSAIPEHTLPYWIDYAMNLRVFGALAAVSLGSVLVFALVPAIQASRTDVNRALKDGGRTSTVSRGARRWTTAFLAAEIALAVILMAQVALASLQSDPDLPTDRMIETAEVMTAAVTLPAAGYATPAERLTFFRQVEARLGAAPGIASASFASALPASGAAERELDIAGREHGLDQTAPTVWVVETGPAYLETLGLAVTRGRPLSEIDGRPGHRNVIVNERLVQMFFDGEQPLGRHIALTPESTADGPPEWLTIVGVAPTIRQPASPDPEPVVYVPLGETAPATAFLMARRHGDSTDIGSLLRTAVQAVDDSVPLYRMRTLATAIDDAEWNGRVSARLALTLTFICVLLATVGLYAVTAHGVTLRTQEIGVRMALGARPLQVVRVVMRGVRVPLVLGFLFGILGTVAWDRAFAAGESGARAADAYSLLIITAMLAVLTLVACFVPARRAARLDPLRALRHE